MIVLHCLLNVCVVIAAYHNHIIKVWWKLKHLLGGNYGPELLTKAPMDHV